MAAPAAAGAALAPPPRQIRFRRSTNTAANNPYGDEYAAGMVYVSEEDPVQSPQSLFDMVIASSSNMGVLLNWDV
jgi:hypothetical protein